MINEDKTLCVSAGVDVDMLTGCTADEINRFQTHLFPRYRIVVYGRHSLTRESNIRLQVHKSQNNVIYIMTTSILVQFHVSAHICEWKIMVPCAWCVISVIKNTINANSSVRTVDFVKCFQTSKKADSHAPITFL